MYRILSSMEAFLTETDKLYEILSMTYFIVQI